VCLCVCVVVESMWAINIRRWVHSCSCSHSFSFTLSFSVVSCLQTTDDGLSLSLFLTPCLSNSRALSLSRSLALSLTRTLVRSCASCRVYKRLTMGSLSLSLSHSLSLNLTLSLVLSLSRSLVLFRSRCLHNQDGTDGCCRLMLRERANRQWRAACNFCPHTSDDGFSLSFLLIPFLPLSLALSLSRSLALSLSRSRSLALRVFTTRVDSCCASERMGNGGCNGPYAQCMQTHKR